MKGNSASAGEVLQRGCEKLDIAVDASGEDKLIAHTQLLAKWNRTHNLTAVTDPVEMIVQHVLDCLAIHPYVRGSRLLDVGSGGGFPGLALAIAQPDLEVTVLDSRGKRVEFLKYVAGQLDLDNVVAVKSRIEDYQPKEKFDTLAARAFSSLSEFVSLTRAFQLSGTRVLAMKGKSPIQEIDDLADEVKSSLEIVPLDVPFLDAERHLIIMDF